MADLQRFHAYRSDAELANYQGWSPMTVDDARAFIDEMSLVSGLRRGAWIQLGIADSASDVLIGDMGVFTEAEEPFAEIGFTLSKAAQGMGHATRAVQALLSVIFGSCAVSAVRAVTDARNLSSVRVLERAGFVSRQTRAAWFKGEHCVEIVYVFQRPEGQPIEGSSQ